MKPLLILLILETVLGAAEPIKSEQELLQAFDRANHAHTAQSIILDEEANIQLHKPLIYSNHHPLHIQGNGANIHGEKLSNQSILTLTQGADLDISHLSLSKSPRYAIHLMVPQNSQKPFVRINFNRLSIYEANAHGIYIDDTAHSKSGIDFSIKNSTLKQNGYGFTDSDAIRIDERGDGSIKGSFIHCDISENGGDGVELDERENGSVQAVIRNVILNINGFFSEKDPEDGFDIDERGVGDVSIHLDHVTLEENAAQGLDFDEKDYGNMLVKLSNLTISESKNEGIKLNESGAGTIILKLYNSKISHCGSNGVCIVEKDKGTIWSKIKKVKATNNQKYGIKIKQNRQGGSLTVQKLQLKNNKKGDTLKLKNIHLP